jgi:hypothetical protein
MRIWVIQFVFSSYPLIVVGLVSDPICWLSASYLEPAEYSEKVSAIKHGLTDLELVR